ncbi:MAG: hypothetical protein J6X85_07310 [Ruminococcus sp.]|nr:hypothetical protein [Ruminococcus sp.]
MTLYDAIKAKALGAAAVSDAYAAIMAASISGSKGKTFLKDKDGYYLKDKDEFLLTGKE